MMNVGRPEGQKEFIRVTLGKANEDALLSDDIALLGAYAVLDGIWRMAKESPTGTFIFDTHYTINNVCLSQGILDE